MPKFRPPVGEQIQKIPVIKVVSKGSNISRILTWRPSFITDTTIYINAILLFYMIKKQVILLISDITATKYTYDWSIEI